MKRHRTLLAIVAMTAIAVAPARAEDFWSNLKKDFKGLTGAIKEGIDDIGDGKKDVEEVVEETRQLEEELTGVSDDEPRYDSAWIAELQQRLSAAGFDPGPVDGAFGRRTSRAISAFQQQAGISPDGEPRPTVMRALRARTQGVRTAQPSSGASAPLGHGQAPEAGSVHGAPSPAAALAEAGYPEFVRLALQADPAAFAAQREAAGVAYRLAVMDGAACRQLSQRLSQMSGDAFLARDFVLEAADLLDEALADLDTAPAALEVTLSDRVPAQPYDFAAEGYPLSASTLIRGGRRDLTDRTSAPPCDAGLRLHHALPKSAMSISQVGLGRLSTELEGAPGASILPMAKSDARAFEARNEGRSIDLVGHVRLEPPEAAFGPLRGRILALEARDPGTGETLYRFPIAPEVASDQAPPLPPGLQEVTYERLLEAHLALHPELAEDDDFALRYLSYLPEDQDCPAEFQLLEGSEFDRQRFFTQVWPGWKARFAETVSKARPPGDEVFRAKVERTAGEYDFATGAFAVAFADPRGEVTVGQASYASLAGRDMRFCTRTSGRSSFPQGFTIDLADADVIDRVPLSADAAEAFDQRNPDRKLQVAVDFVLEETKPAGNVGLAAQGTGRIVGATVVDPVSGEVLHRYDPAMFSPPAADPWDAVPDPDHRRLFLSLVARSPDLARNDAYVERFIANEACDALRATRDNEIERAQLIEKWRPRLEREVAHAPQGQKVKVTLQQRLGEYEVDRQAFPFPDSGGLNRHNRTRIQVSSGTRCPTVSSDAPGSFWIVIEAPETLFQTGLPVPSDTARRLLDSDRGRVVDLDLLVELGTPGQLDGSPAQVPATIIDARVREPNARTVLHHYGTGFFAGDAVPGNPYAGIDELAHEPLMLAYLMAQPQLAEDRDFAQRYAAATKCKAWMEKRDDEFARADLGHQAQQQIRQALAQGAGGSSDGRYRISIEAELGVYDFADGRFPLEVPVFDQQIYRDLLDASQPAVLIEHDGKSCRRYSVSSPSFPDAFLVTLGGAEAIEAIGVPADLDAARAFLQRDLPPHRNPRAVRIEMLVAAGAASAPQRTHPQRDERVSIVPGTVVSARVVDGHGDEPVFDYGADPFGGVLEPAAGPALAATAPAVPEGAAFVLVSSADPAELEAYAVVEGSGFDLPPGEPIKGRFVLHNHYDETTDLWAVLKGAPQIGVVLSAEQFAQASGELAGLDLHVEAYRPGGGASDEPKVRSAAALSAATPTKTRADERGAKAFKILNVTVGMSEPEALAAIAGEFASDQITTDAERGALAARKGACNDTDPADPAIASEAGAFCFDLELADGLVSRVTLRQVVAGDVAARALAAFRERYGEPAFEDQSRPRPSVQRSVIGWGRSLDNASPGLAGIDADGPKTVLEGRVWRTHGVTVAILHLDDGRAAKSPEGPAAGQEIKF